MQIDTDVLLAELHRKRAEIDAAIKAVESVRALAGSSTPTPLPALTAVTPELLAPRSRLNERDPPKALRPVPAAAVPKPCARVECGKTVKPRTTPGRPKRFCSKACAQQAYRESEERIGATTAINRR